MRHWALACLLLSGLYGCATSSAIPPAELKRFPPRATVERLWQADVGADIPVRGGQFEPAVAETSVVAAGGEGRVSAYDIDSGEKLWGIDLSQDLASGVDVDDLNAYVYSVSGELIALSLADGAEQWRTQWLAEVLAPPRAAQGYVLLRSSDGRIASFDALDGTSRWVVSNNVPTLSVRGNSAPTLVNDGALVGLDNGQVSAITLTDGRTLWSAPVSQPRGRTEVERLVDVDGEIAIDEEAAYAVSYQGRLVQISPQGGRIGWSRNLSSVTGVSERSGVLYSSDTDGTVWAVNARNGEPLWEQAALARRRLTLPLAVEDRFVVVGDYAGYLHWLMQDSGEFAARMQLDDDGFSGRLKVVDDVVLAQGRSGKLAAYRLK